MSKRGNELARALCEKVERDGLPIDTVDWQHYHIQAAIAAMQGMLANPHCSQVQVESGEPFGYFYAMNAIMCADILVEELKKGGQDGTSKI